MHGIVLVFSYSATMELNGVTCGDCSIEYLTDSISILGVSFWGGGGGSATKNYALNKSKFFFYILFITSASLADQKPYQFLSNAK